MPARLAETHTSTGQAVSQVPVLTLLPPVQKGVPAVGREPARAERVARQEAALAQRKIVAELEELVTLEVLEEVAEVAVQLDRQATVKSVVFQMELVWERAAEVVRTTARSVPMAQVLPVAPVAMVSEEPAGALREAEREVSVVVEVAVQTAVARAAPEVRTQRSTVRMVQVVEEEEEAVVRAVAAELEVLREAMVVVEVVLPVPTASRISLHPMAHKASSLLPIPFQLHMLASQPARR